MNQKKREKLLAILENKSKKITNNGRNEVCKSGSVIFKSDNMNYCIPENLINLINIKGNTLYYKPKNKENFTNENLTKIIDFIQKYSSIKYIYVFNKLLNIDEIIHPDINPGNYYTKLLFIYLKNALFYNEYNFNLDKQLQHNKAYNRKISYLDDELKKEKSDIFNLKQKVNTLEEYKKNLEIKNKELEIKLDNYIIKDENNGKEINKKILEHDKKIRSQEEYRVNISNFLSLYKKYFDALGNISILPKPE